MKNEQKNAQDPVPENPRMPLTRRNYVLLAIAIAVLDAVMERKKELGYGY